MIASLSGTVASISGSQIVVDVQSVGYLVHSTNQAVKDLQVGAQITLHTSLVVREDSFTLYGFADKRDLEFFDLLRSVNGVGPKSALSILSELSADEIASAVSNESDQTFKSVSGIGAKTAKLIVVSLAGKLSSGKAGVDGSSSASAIRALVGLGWSEKQARDAVGAASKQASTQEQILKDALKLLSKARKG